MGYVAPLDAVEFSTNQVHRFITEDCHFPVTITKVELAAATGELKSVRATRHNRYSRRMALEWLESLGVHIDWEVAAAEAEREVLGTVAAQLASPRF
ncbi:hypothetical protein [Mycolicibacterium brisbanense]|uniref:Uncharacterized protein n=1 Tax=Mycolicibacterium brisbanense TaxID=146020 RepID=A0A124DZC4_9MYCO|nr:hypothetical protein [Mycolicibacterium brisbanense]MCV7159627.1 hypothetical protein [Mycolicibacterium brisbanense]GAS86943.1 uncharacterized protein RMCB_1039 [Mycolicibacterium brisbanense]